MSRTHLLERLRALDSALARDLDPYLQRDLKERRRKIASRLQHDHALHNPFRASRTASDQ